MSIAKNSKNDSRHIVELKNFRAQLKLRPAAPHTGTQERNERNGRRQPNNCRGEGDSDLAGAEKQGRKYRGFGIHQMVCASFYAR